MKLKFALTSLIASALMCAPAFALDNGQGGSKCTLPFLAPVLCDQEGELYSEGAFTNWVTISRSHFKGLTVGMTNPDGGYDDAVGQRISGRTRNQLPFGPAKQWSITFNPSSSANGFLGTVLSIPTFGTYYDFNANIVFNSDGTVTASEDFSGYPQGTQFIGIYLWNVDVDSSFSNTVISAEVNGVTPTPNYRPSTSPTTNGFAIDCNSFFDSIEF